MRRYELLRKQVLEASTVRGHRMTPFQWYPFTDPRWLKDGAEHHSQGNSVCKDCAASVTVRTHPEPNQSDIAGEAVALNCSYGISKGEHNA